MKNGSKRSLFLGFALGSVTAVLLVVIFIWYVLLEAPIPFKVTDPSDPNFDPLKFKYTDYYSESEFAAAIKTMFPVGTKKNDVDRILIDIGEGTAKKYNYQHESLKDKNTYRYRYNSPFRKALITLFFPMPSDEWPSHYIAIDYDKEDRVERVNVMFGMGLPKPFGKKSKEQKQIEDLLREYN